MVKKKLLFVISQFYKGGAEVSLVNLLRRIDKEAYEIDLMVMNQYPMKGAVDLIPMLPAHIRLINIYKQEQMLSQKQKLQRKMLCSPADLQQYPLSALLYVRAHEYDWAFHIGEWWLPGFVAEKVCAANKAAWIHNDLSEAEYFEAGEFFKFDEAFKKYVFVSKRSMNASINRFHFLQQKSLCIYNINDAEEIRKRASAAVTDELPERNGLTVLTCANVRKQKNHLRQLKAMKILKDRGIDFTWLNIGSTADAARTEKLLTSAKEYGLEDRFLLLGPKENPYQYMAMADIVAVLSDYESWSMVITEAKILGIPVISTKTSGALEQIEDGKTGVLTEFDAVDIADQLEHLLTSESLRSEIRKNIRNFDNTQEILRDFYSLLDDQSDRLTGKKILYVVDDINYQGGAHIATKNQIYALLEEKQDITVFSGTLPSVKVRNELCGVKFIGWQNCRENQLFNRRLADCLTDRFLADEQKKYKLKMTWESKVKKNVAVFDEYVKPCLSRLFSDYDTVCVMSEGSPFRREVAASTAERKVQYIHTDYACWSKLSDWTRKATAYDEEIYAGFHKIVLLSESIREGFIAMYPSLREKAVVNQNMMPVEEIRKKAEKKPAKGSLVKFVTVGRIDYYKGFDRIYRALESLYDEGYQFQWTIVGDGEDYETVKSRFERSRFADRVRMIGATTNPFPFVKEADVFALFSRYEGLPNTIYEALILGVPVIATNVGGISSQIEAGRTGWLVENEEGAILKGLEHILMNADEVAAYKENLKNYEYQNSAISERMTQILGIE